jgi:pimeloyl-ACP methyl ester carboxylesterase
MKKPFLTILLIIITMLTTNAQTKNIVIVHGAFADASGWEDVYKILKSRGYNVTLVQNPLTSLEDDVSATERIIAKQDGQVILVGHSWGGAVITQAGVSSKVVGLVYVAAFVPDAGEAVLDIIKTEAPDPENGILPPDANGFVWYDKAKFHKGFAADVSEEKAEFMYASQGPIAVKCFLTPITSAAWKSKPSWAIVAAEDKSINPSMERKMYKRANAIVSEINGSHAIYISKAKEVAEVIEVAATAGK